MDTAGTESIGDKTSQPASDSQREIGARIRWSRRWLKRTQIDQSGIRLFWFPADGCALLCITRFPLHFHRLLTLLSSAGLMIWPREAARHIYGGASRGLVHWNRGNLDL